MIYWMKPLPDGQINTADWKRFIENEWFRRHFMWFVYGLQTILLMLSIRSGAWDFSNFFVRTGLLIGTFIIHELLHLMVVYRIGDVSITYSGLFFWISSGAVLSKFRFLVFMSLPLVGLTVVPAVFSMFLSGACRDALVYVAWVNAVSASSDIINSLLIAIKPHHALFYRGYYREGADMAA